MGCTFRHHYFHAWRGWRGLFNSEQVVRANPGDVIKIADRNVTFTGIQQVQGPNYQAIAAQLEYRDEAGACSLF